MKQYLKRTWKNKLAAIGLIIPSLIPIWLERDATVFVLMAMIAIPLFFATQNYVGRRVGDEQ